MARPTRQLRVPVITLVTSSGCHLCEMAKDVIASVAVETPLRLETVELASPDGAEIAKLHRMAFPPLILINGQPHAHGRISEKKFRHALDLLAADSVNGPISGRSS